VTNLRTWIAPVPDAGTIGTGPGDLAMGSASLTAPEGFDLPGGSASVLYRAYEWFLKAHQASTNSTEGREHLIGAARAMNNLGVWFLVKYDEPDAGSRAFKTLREAERIIVTGVKPPSPTDVSGIYFNLSELYWHAGREEQSRKYFERADESGWTQNAPWADATIERRRL
jgi:hypothetical protein